MRLGAIGSAASEDEVAAVAQLVECVLGKDEVTGSIPVSSFFWECRTANQENSMGRAGTSRLHSPF